MSRYQIKSVLETLAQGQGFYGRLLDSIENSDYQDEIWEQLENSNFQDDVDIILFFET